MTAANGTLRDRIAKHLIRQAGVETLVAKPGEWIPIDKWIRAHEAVRDPSGHYGSVGLRGNGEWV